MLQTRDSRPQPLILRPWKSHLPDDIVLNILSRIPVKSLIRFRCVCKTWDSSITTPNFISTDLNKNNDHDHACLIQTCIQYNSYKIPKVYKVLCCDRMLDWVFEYSVPSAFDLNMSEMVSSCNGLVCLIQHANRSNTDDAIYLWNASITK
ncbi:hypothetical protein RGQ29_017176 [Quercus rubra]|uniref:F-box domain-containing protein n=1 Tax=Quercus rubra TaxID=3512 RepID=A0AAN7FFW1_QUERU|nr:hypothetical protein RGQ29_017176 [Quercus rubra]